MTDQDVLDFASAALKKISDLELLLFLRLGRDRGWTPAELVRDLRSSALMVENSLAQLKAVGLVAEPGPGLFQMAPQAPDREALLSALGVLYRERPFLLISSIVEQVSSPLQSFSDAFKLKD